MSYPLIVLGWIIFGAIHSLTASRWLKQLVSAKFTKLYRYYRLIYNGLALLTLWVVLWLHRLAPDDYLCPWQGSFLLGMLVSGLGGAIAILALRAYDLPEFIGWPTTIRQTSAQGLQQHGPLQYVRHPLYSGILLVLLGIGITQPAWSYLILLLAASVYIRIGIYFEEQKLIATFGNAYKQYRERVPMLLPRF